MDIIKLQWFALAGQVVKTPVFLGPFYPLFHNGFKPWNHGGVSGSCVKLRLMEKGSMLRVDTSQAAP